MRLIAVFGRAIAAINRSAALLAGLSLLLMALLGAGDVVGTAFGRPVAGAYELIETLLVGAIFLAIAAAQQNRAHISVDLVRSRLGIRGRAALAVLSVIGSGAFFALVAHYGWSAFGRSWASGEFRQGLLAFPVWPARLVLALGASLMVLQCLRDLVVFSRALVLGIDIAGPARPAEAKQSF